MQLAGVRRATAAAVETLRRYPFVLASALVAAVAGVLLVDGPEDHAHLRLLLAATLGIPVLVALATLASRHPGSALLRLALPGLAALALAFVFLASASWPDPLLFRRYAQFALAGHLIVAVLAFAGRGEPNGFWQFNRRLFERFLVSAVFSAVLFLGLSLAVAATDHLLGVPVADETYGRLWFLVAFLFNTWYFLGGVPERLEELEESRDYPQVLRIFSQFILVPLVLIYLLILTAYLGRVAVTREWPSGWIGYLVSGVSVLGILALLLVHPVRDRPENRWVASFARWFWVALLPPIAMLFLAVAKRIGQYGVTENRYFLLAFAAWLAGLSLWFIVRRSQNLAVVPWSLAAVALVTSCGPWSAYSVSRGSQVNRLQGLLERHGLADGDSLRVTAGAVSFEDRREIGATLRYVVEHHGTGPVETWLAQVGEASDSVRADLVPERKRDHARPDRLARAFVEHLELEYVDRWAQPAGDAFSCRAAETPLVVDVRGWDYAIALRRLLPGGAAQAPPAERFSVSWDEDAYALRVLEGDRERIRIPLAPLRERVRSATRARGSSPDLPARELRVEHAEDGVRAMLQVSWMSGARADGEDRLTGIDGTLYLALPEAPAGR